MATQNLPKPQTDLPLPEKELPASEPVAITKPIWKSKFLWGFVLLSTLAAFIAGGLFLNKNQTKYSPSPSPTKSADETAHWKTYENSTYHFSFKYPGEWNISEKSERAGDPREYLVTLKSRDGKTAVFQAEVLHYQGEDLKAFINSWYGGLEGGPSNIESISVNDQNGYKFFMGKAGVNPAGAANASFKDGFTVVTISTAIENGSVSEIMSNKIFNQILSTFKFTNPSVSQSFLEIPEYGVRFALTSNIKDAYYLPETASKGYIYLKVHSLDSEPKCKSDPSSTAAIARQGKNDPMPFDLSYEEFKNRFPGAEIGNNYYYIDLAQYACADSAAGRSLLEKVRKEFSAASKTITAQ